MKKIVLKKCKGCHGKGQIQIESYTPWNGAPFETSIHCTCGKYRVRVNGDNHDEVLESAVHYWNTQIENDTN